MADHTFTNLKKEDIADVKFAAFEALAGDRELPLLEQQAMELEEARLFEEEKKRREEVVVTARGRRIRDDDDEMDLGEETRRRRRRKPKSHEELTGDVLQDIYEWNEDPDKYAPNSKDVAIPWIEPIYDYERINGSYYQRFALKRRRWRGAIRPEQNAPLHAYARWFTTLREMPSTSESHPALQEKTERMDVGGVEAASSHGTSAASSAISGALTNIEKQVKICAHTTYTSADVKFRRPKNIKRFAAIEGTTEWDVDSVKEALDKFWKEQEPQIISELLQRSRESDGEGLAVIKERLASQLNTAATIESVDEKVSTYYKEERKKDLIKAIKDWSEPVIDEAEEGAAMEVDDSTGDIRGLERQGATHNDITYKAAARVIFDVQPALRAADVNETNFNQIMAGTIALDARLQKRGKGRYKDSTAPLEADSISVINNANFIQIYKYWVQLPPSKPFLEKLKLLYETYPVLTTRIEFEDNETFFNLVTGSGRVNVGAKSWNDDDDDIEEDDFDGVTQLDLFQTEAFVPLRLFYQNRDYLIYDPEREYKWAFPFQCRIIPPTRIIAYEDGNDIEYIKGYSTFTLAVLPYFNQICTENPATVAQELLFSADPVLGLAVLGYENGGVFQPYDKIRIRFNQHYKESKAYQELVKVSIEGAGLKMPEIGEETEVFHLLRNSVTEQCYSADLINKTKPITTIESIYNPITSVTELLEAIDTFQESQVPTGYEGLGGPLIANLVKHLRDVQGGKYIHHELSSIATWLDLACDRVMDENKVRLSAHSFIDIPKKNEFDCGLISPRAALVLMLYFGPNFIANSNIFEEMMFSNFSELTPAIVEILRYLRNRDPDAIFPSYMNDYLGSSIRVAHMDQASAHASWIQVILKVIDEGPQGAAQRYPDIDNIPRTYERLEPPYPSINSPEELTVMLKTIIQKTNETKMPFTDQIKVVMSSILQIYEQKQHARPMACEDNWSDYVTSAKFCNLFTKDSFEIPDENRNFERLVAMAITSFFRYLVDPLTKRPELLLLSFVDGPVDWSSIIFFAPDMFDRNVYQLLLSQLAVDPNMGEEGERKDKARDIISWLYYDRIFYTILYEIHQFYGLDGLSKFKNANADSSSTRSTFAIDYGVLKPTKIRKRQATGASEQAAKRPKGTQRASEATVDEEPIEKDGDTILAEVWKAVWDSLTKKVEIDPCSDDFSTQIQNALKSGWKLKDIKLTSFKKESLEKVVANINSIAFKYTPLAVLLYRRALQKKVPITVMPHIKTLHKYLGETGDPLSIHSFHEETAKNFITNTENPIGEAWTCMYRSWDCFKDTFETKILKAANTPTMKQDELTTCLSTIPRNAFTRDRLLICIAMFNSIWSQSEAMEESYATLEARYTTYIKPFLQELYTLCPMAVRTASIFHAETLSKLITSMKDKIEWGILSPETCSYITEGLPSIVEKLIALRNIDLSQVKATWEHNRGTSYNTVEKLKVISVEDIRLEWNLTLTPRFTSPWKTVLLYEVDTKIGKTSARSLEHIGMIYRQITEANNAIVQLQRDIEELKGKPVYLDAETLKRVREDIDGQLTDRNLKLSDELKKAMAARDAAQGIQSEIQKLESEIKAKASQIEKDRKKLAIIEHFCATFPFHMHLLEIHKTDLKENMNLFSKTFATLPPMAQLYGAATRPNALPVSYRIPDWGESFRLEGTWNPKRQPANAPKEPNELINYDWRELVHFYTHGQATGRWDQITWLDFAAERNNHPSLEWTIATIPFFKYIAQVKHTHTQEHLEFGTRSNTTWIHELVDDIWNERRGIQADSMESRVVKYGDAWKTFAEILRCAPNAFAHLEFRKEDPLGAFEAADMLAIHSRLMRIFNPAERKLTPEEEKNITRAFGNRTKYLYLFEGDTDDIKKTVKDVLFARHFQTPNILYVLYKARIDQLNTEWKLESHVKKHKQSPLISYLREMKRIAELVKSGRMDVSKIRFNGVDDGLIEKQSKKVFTPLESKGSS